MHHLLNYKLLLASTMLLLGQTVKAQFDPAAGSLGSKAIHQDSSAIVDWATQCSITRGPMDFSDNTLGDASIGREKEAFGKADDFVVSLGDGGNAIITIDGSLYNGVGPDFAVFENAFDDNFLELAFVEVSSDGQNYVRFPAVSLTQTKTQIGGFDYLEPTDLNNFAGKYRKEYGVPFDLEELKDSSDVDIDKITHIKIVDVVGSIDTTRMHSKDSKGNVVNDPWPTPYESSGFDLDAVGFIHMRGNSIHEAENTGAFAYVAQQSIYTSGNLSTGTLSIFSLNGSLLANEPIEADQAFKSAPLLPGVYLVRFSGENFQTSQKVVVF